MSDIILAGSSRLWCRTCGDTAKAWGWSGDLIVDWIQEHQCGLPTEEDLRASAAIRQRTVERDRSLAILEEFAEATKDVPVTFDPDRDTHGIARRLIRNVPLSEALGLPPEAPENGSPAVSGGV